MPTFTNPQDTEPYNTNYHRDITHHQVSYNGNVKIKAAKATNQYGFSCHLLLESLCLLQRQNPFPELLLEPTSWAWEETSGTCTWGKVWAKLEPWGLNSGDWWQIAWWESWWAGLSTWRCLLGTREKSLKARTQAQSGRKRLPGCGTWPSESCGGWECQLKRGSILRAKKCFLFNSCCLIAPSNGI